MVERKPVRVNVFPETKEEWNEIAERENRNLSDTIRKAMSEYIARRNGEGQENDGLPESVEEEIYRTGDTVENLQSQINQLSSRFDVVESQIQKKKEIQTVANEVYEILPGPSSVGEFAELLDGSETYVGTIEWLAGCLGETEGMIEQAADQLLADNYHVHEVSIKPGSSRRFYKEGGN